MMLMVLFGRPTFFEVMQAFVAVMIVGVVVQLALVTLIICSLPVLKPSSIRHLRNAEQYADDNQCEKFAHGRDSVASNPH